jgi:hypothetical protein
MNITENTSFETILMIKDMGLYQRIKLYKEGLFEIPTSSIVRVYKDNRLFPQCPEGYELKESYANVNVIFNNYDIITDSFTIDGEVFYMSNKERKITPMDHLFKKIENV